MIAERFVGEYTKWQSRCEMMASQVALNKKGLGTPLDFDGSDEKGCYYYNESRGRMNDLLYI